MRSVTLIGVGRVGKALVYSLPRTDYRIDALVVSNRAKWIDVEPTFPFNEKIRELTDIPAITSDVVLISTPDDMIGDVAGAIEPLIGSGTAVFHVSGALSSSNLAVLRERGALIGSIHPLISVAGNQNSSEKFKGAFFCVEGDTDAIPIANSIVKSLGGKPFTIDSDKKTLYHAAAVMACGHLVALIDTSIELLAKCGVDAAIGRTLLMPLISSTVENLRTMKPAVALTGPFARTDAATIDRHLKALAELSDEMLMEIYLELGERSLLLAEQNGADHLRVDGILKKMEIAKGTLK